jgi:hypothetical protein
MDARAMRGRQKTHYEPCSQRVDFADLNED